MDEFNNFQAILLSFLSYLRKNLLMILQSALNFSTARCPKQSEVMQKQSSQAFMDSLKVLIFSKMRIYTNFYGENNN